MDANREQLAAGGSRAALAERQAALVRALTTGEPVGGFDPDQIRRSVFALRSKRRRAVARAWPGVAGALRDRFDALFGAYAETHPLPAEGPRLDGYLFARWVQAREALPERGVREVLGFELERARGVVVRLHPVSGGWVVGVRVLGLVRIWRLKRLTQFRPVA